MVCAVEDCANNKSKSRLFSFPKDAKLCKKWTQFCRRSNQINTKLEKICAEHFQQDDFQRDLPYEFGIYSKPRPLKLKPGVVPSVYNDNGFEIDFDEAEDSICFIIDAKDERKAQKAKAVAQRKQIVNALMTEYDEKQVYSTEAQKGEDNDNDEIAGLPTDEIVQVVVDAEAYLTSLDKENTDLKRENFKLKLDAQKYALEKEQLEHQLNKANARYTHLFSQLEFIFSKAQIQRLETGKSIAWPKEDLKDAFALYTASPDAYTLLLRKRFPLPPKRTLQNWYGTEKRRSQRAKKKLKDKSKDKMQQEKNLSIIDEVDNNNL